MADDVVDWALAGGRRAFRAPSVALLSLPFAPRFLLATEPQALTPVLAMSIELSGTWVAGNRPDHGCRSPTAPASRLLARLRRACAARRCSR
jgi:hypothetical protein